MGLDTDITEPLERVASAELRPDALVIGVGLPEATDDVAASVAEVVLLLESELSRVSPRIVIAVVGAAGRTADGRTFAGELIERVSTHSSNALGHDLTAIAVVIDDDAERDLAAERIAEHLSGRSNLGDGTVVTTRDLRRSTLRELILEDVL